MIEISVVLCSYNRIDSLKKVLLSLADQTLPADQFEVVVVDDGSSDGTSERVRALVVPYKLVLCTQANAGLATARNTGIMAASGWVVLFIDGDVLADQRLLAEHLRTHFKHKLCVVNGWVNHVQTPVRPEKRRFTMADISTSFFWTSNVSVKREHLLAAGLFDEQFREYGWEDQELGLRLMALGLKARNNYRAVGYHVKRAPQATDVRGMIRQAEAKARTAMLYVKKHRRLRSRFSTGIHPPRLAIYRMATVGGILEKFCRSQLGLDQPEATGQKPLNALQRWCARELATIHYFRTISRGG
jgi:glycosyltransferase involved in cell wall biosynthesis